MCDAEAVGGIPHPGEQTEMSAENGAIMPRTAVLCLLCLGLVVQEHRVWMWNASLGIGCQVAWPFHRHPSGLLGACLPVRPRKGL